MDSEEAEKNYKWEKSTIRISSLKLSLVRVIPITGLIYTLSEVKKMEK